MDQQVAPRTHGLVLHWAARYDLLACLVTHGRERELRETIIRLAGLKTGNDVLDIGCGTGTLAIIATRHVGATGAVTGIDASPSMIVRANRKARKAGARVSFQVALAESLHFPDRRFDVVFSTLMLHHLPRNTRQQCASEIERVLKVGGRVVAVDFGRARRRGLGSTPRADDLKTSPEQQARQRDAEARAAALGQALSYRGVARLALLRLMGER